MQLGYYLIGRHKECQIRPKSRSVSRRHCVVHRQESGLQVLDLDSTSGTSVNEEKIAPRVWVALSDGDTLRCGKIVFRVVIVVPAKQPTRSREKVAATVGAGGESMISGEAWQEIDIADYLESADTEDRERRYESIRAKQDAEETIREFDTADELDVFEDSFADPSDAVPQSAVSETAGVGPSGAKENAAPRQAATKNQKPIRMPKKKLQRAASGGGGWLAAWSQPDRLKVMGVTLLLACGLGLLGYSAYQFYNGPTTRVLQGID